MTEHRGPSWPARMRLLGGAALLAVVVGRVGTGPLVDGLRTVNGWSLPGAAGIAVVTTTCCAWRWGLVARGLGVAVPMRTAFAAYYRSQFLNTTLPGGVLGDVHRAVRHGREVGDVGRGLRAVAWERTAGQAVQLVLTVMVLTALPSPVRSWMPTVLAMSVIGALLVALWLRRTRPGGSIRLTRILHTAAGDIRDGLLAPGAWPGIVVTSAVVVAGHGATFLIAARTAGSTAPTAQLLPLALLVLLAMGLPVNISGWGPREGMAAWVFAAAGLGAAQGVAASVVYGVMALVSSLPGAAVLVVDWIPRRGRVLHRDQPGPAATSVKGAARG